MVAREGERERESKLSERAQRKDENKRRGRRL
jgi:hypothetical protein